MRDWQHFSVLGVGTKLLLFMKMLLSDTKLVLNNYDSQMEKQISRVSP